MDGAAGALSDTERFARLRLARSRQVGPSTYVALLARYGTGIAAVDALAAGMTGRFSRVVLSPQAAIEQELERAHRLGARLVLLGEDAYPPLLAALSGPPPALALMGDPAVFRRPALAVVGSRNASLAGTAITRALCENLARCGMVIVSGLARGIDTAAHEAGLATGTVGVFAGGLDRPYPPENKGLMRRIVDRAGCLVSEMPFGREPRAVDFPRRNRLVAGLSHGLLVVEAALRSGSLISAASAAQIGRRVFAVPGSPLDARAAGPNQLIRNGAILVTSADDIKTGLRGAVSLAGASSQPSLALFGGGEDADILGSLLGVAPVSIDDLVAQSGCAAPRVQEALLELELAGRLERHYDGRVSLCG
ncbi:DNA-processing protein DprA [Aureimonas frigidaquae]|uniref:DNA processing chain A n=1 Tax=Aureimonas frigidaquae TaxID=424757 RepID=A0A0P0Z4G6_9HYPH|nr:DNA-processing protein DprA [Aureimonas frigidaquae]BAT28910.1 DNA processing chain A [Aureimonas frigidaquae]